MGTASPGVAQSLSEERREQMERDPSHRSPTLHEPLVQPLSPSSQYLLAHGLHGADWRELLKKG